jgi:hypothetical protein
VLTVSFIVLWIGSAALSWLAYFLGAGSFVVVLGYAGLVGFVGAVLCSLVFGLSGFIRRMAGKKRVH